MRFGLQVGSPDRSAGSSRACSIAKAESAARRAAPWAESSRHAKALFSRALRRYAAFSLARIDDQESLPLLRERMEAETSSWTRQAIEHAIRELEKSEGATQS